LKTALIGFGDISEKHISVLNELNCKIDGVLVQNPTAYVEKSKKFGIDKFYTSLDEIKNSDCDFIMIMASAENNCQLLKSVMSFKKPIFIEKPVGFSSQEIDQVIQINQKFQLPIMVGMNRRYYSIFHSAINYLKLNNKKINSIFVEAPERFSDINKAKFSDNVKKHWMFSNSIHCIDLIRFFSGDIKEITSYSDPSKFVFNAVGVSEQNIPFVYSSNWLSPGKWSITIYADDVRIVFNPLENGKIITKNHIQEIIPSEDDIKFKPGFYSQLKYFLENVIEKHQLVWPCSDLIDHKKSLETIEKIFPTTLDIPFKK
jgi:predicted dehydrogenase